MVEVEKEPMGEAQSGWKMCHAWSRRGRNCCWEFGLGLWQEQDEPDHKDGLSCGAQVEVRKCARAPALELYLSRSL